MMRAEASFKGEVRYPANLAVGEKAVQSWTSFDFPHFQRRMQSFKKK
jgi:hypothetical protein